SFGAFRNIGGEVVFNTAMTGYPESLTDPSYAGQILVLTYPLIGNYGVPANDLWESTQIYAEALIVSDYSEAFSHWNGKESLGDWLKREQRPAITGIDTRALTRLLRERGVMMGRIEIEGVENTPLNLDYGDINYVETVSCQDIIRYNEGAGKRVVLVDCGVKANIIRCLMKRGVEIIRVPWDYDFNSLDFDGLLISNGPGNPDNCQVTVNHIQRAMQNNKPVFGICMGNQLLAKASGATVYKLKYGHRSHNQPVRMVGTERCFITSQNHGYAVDSTTLNEEWLPLFENMNDGSNEGIRHRYKPWFSVQFHPEAAAGPTDTEFLFDEFIKLL
ncbi:MAG: glutamine-hydrolyzing carbamoyl-phosphate synthase small subunit, partial [Bacteroidales bacterium]|nr:glutamine-hydrolyzing carbamoyl-phosphate synthase small subunit [Bacteroidales bacterium]